MRSVLFTIPLDGQVGAVPVFGFGLLLAIWAILGATYVVLTTRRGGWKELSTGTGIVWVVVAVAIVKAPDFHKIPVYGYGTMLFLGFLASASFAAWRIRREGFDGEIAWDVAMWVFVAGIIGGRIFYVAQYRDKFFGPDPLTGKDRTVPEILKALINLPDGGLVLYGGLILAPLMYYLFCRRRGIAPLALGDIVISSIFIGLMFGRLGCLMHGCCYGDVCSLPWAMTFPQHSVPFEALVGRGLLSKDAAESLPLHPTQLYDSINALLLTLLTWTFYPFRRRSGEVLALGWIAYPINRFLIEFLRSDEGGKFGTSLTISQWVSLVLLATGVAFYVWLQRSPPGRQLLVGKKS